MHPIIHTCPSSAAQRLGFGAGGTGVLVGQRREQLRSRRQGLWLGSPCLGRASAACPERVSLVWKGGAGEGSSVIKGLISI